MAEILQEVCVKFPDSLGTCSIFMDENNVCRKADSMLSFAINKTRDDLIHYFKAMGWKALRKKAPTPQVREELNVEVGPSQFENLKNQHREYLKLENQRPLSMEEKLHWGQIKLNMNHLIVSEVQERNRKHDGQQK